MKFVPLKILIFDQLLNVYLYFYWNYIDSLFKLCSLNNTNFSFEEERENTVEIIKITC